MNDRVSKTLTAQCGICRGDHITVALSGGRDSVVLTRLLSELREELGFTLSALHIHHGLRAASDEEEQFVRRLCEAYSLPLTVRRLSLGEHKGESMEMAAREARYAVFKEETDRGHYVATAHHLDDCMETFLINLCRGSGVQGLASIPYQRQGIIRPMLDVPSQDVAAYAAKYNLEWREDESNNDTYYLRNFLRREILPRLKSRDDVSFTKGFQTTLGNLREESALLTALSQEDSDSAHKLAALPRPLLWRILRTRCPELSRERFEVIAQRLGKEDFREQVKGELFCTVTNGRLSFSRRSVDQPVGKTPLKDTVILPNKTIETQEIHSQFTHFDIDCDTINNDLFVRTRKDGDRFHPRGMTGSKTVGRLFSEHHLTDRGSRLLVVDAADRVIFIEGFGPDRGHAVTKNTKRALRLHIKEKK